MAEELPMKRSILATQVTVLPSMVRVGPHGMVSSTSASGAAFLTVSRAHGTHFAPIVYLLIFKDFIYLFLERGREGEREGERQKYRSVAS